MAIVPSTEVVPAPDDKLLLITGYPPGSWINLVSWSPEGTQVSFTVRSPGGPEDQPRQALELWVADAATGRARQLLQSPKFGLNSIFDDYVWVDEHTIAACVIPSGVGPVPPKPPLPPGPTIQDNSSGKKAQNRTYPDLLKDEHDEALFEYFGTSEIVVVDTRSGDITKIGAPRMYTEVDVSPDGQYLMVSWFDRPFSYTVPCGRFPKTVALWRRDGTPLRTLAALPMAEDIPIAFNSCRTGPRSISWRDDKPAELCWVEAQDGGDPAVDVSPRDNLYTLPADAAASGAAALRLAGTDFRCGGAAWCDGDLAIVYESWHKTRRSRWWMISPDDPTKEPQLLFDRNYEDAYSDPGSPLSRRTASGTYILAKLDGERKLLMAGPGYGPEGQRPFLEVLDLDTRQTQRLWQSSPPFLESSGSIMSDDKHDEPVTLEGLTVLLTRETVTDPPQTYTKTFTNGGKDSTERQVTNYPHPYPQMRDMQKEVITYARDDGVSLNGTLYLPPGYDKERDGPLPAMIWAYPREFKSKEAAGQLRRSPNAFISIGSSSPSLWVARGYAVLDGPSMPILAEGEEEPNDTFVEQLTASARAAVAELVGRGVADPARISIAGHSYGAFMAVNLLAHCPDLFACAMARSGAYNRTLTPFGFQNEERTIWQAPDIYNKMSPFMLADKIKKPLLLIHGAEDNNTGTFPMQSERLYQAVKGHGGTTRLVLLPHESHGYRARESVLHTLYEVDQWMERYAGYGRTDEAYFAASQDETSPLA